MPSKIPVDLTQTENNELTAVSGQERTKLIPKNDYNINDEYSAVHPDAIADGDSLGRGTGVYLDVYNPTAGTVEDLSERKNSIKINRFNSSKTYPNF
jgi:Na+-translocating ferredoxin:NAD+ oxidoreductase RnfC subunit